MEPIKKNPPTVDLDVEAAVKVDGWTEIRTQRGGEVVGRPPRGLSRPIVRYSKDVSRALHLARKAATKAGRESSLLVSISEDEVRVESRRVKWKQQPSDFAGYSQRTDEIAEMLTRAALALVKE